MRVPVLPARLALLALCSSFAASQSGERAQPAHGLVPCDDSPTAGVRPPGVACAVLAKVQFDSVPHGTVVLRFETFPTLEAARRASAPASSVVRVAGKVWLISLAVPGERSRGGRFVAEVGPAPPLPRASRYEMRVSEADFGPDLNPQIANAVHTHSGPEFWLVLTGVQCLETPAGATRARAGHGMFAPADTPMQLHIVGPTKRDAIFVIVHDAAQPATTVSEWRPTGACR